MRKTLLTLIISLLTVIAAPSPAFAAGGNYYPPYQPPATPAPAAKAAPKTTSTTKTTQTAPTPPACTGAAAPDLNLYSPSEAPVDQNSDGSWTLYLYSPQDPAKWAAYWTGTTGTTYDFEVSSSAATDSTGKFVSPISADSVTGTATQSNDMDISDGQTFYFQINATGPNGCAGKYVTNKITATYNNNMPLTLSKSNHDGPQGTQLFGLVMLSGLAFVAGRHYLRLRRGRYAA